MRVVTWRSILVAAALGAAPPAQAQEPARGPAGGAADGQAAADGDAMAEARELFERGTRLMQNQNWEMALAELERSYERYPTRAALFNLGMCNTALHRYRAALARFDEWQERFAAAASEAERASVAAARDELREYLGFLVVDSEPAGVLVRLDGVEVGTTPLPEPLVVDIGRHRLELSLDGFVASSREVLVVPLETVRELVTLERAGAEVAGAGSQPTPEGEAGVDAVWFWTTASVAVAAGIGAAVAGGMALSQESELGALRDRCGAGDPVACDDGLAALDDYDAAQLAANVLFGVAGTFGVTALVLAFFTDFGFGEEAPPVEVTAGPTGLGASGAPSGFALGVEVRF
jgi:tetratricopeptide (TPR) repeat protein